MCTSVCVFEDVFVCSMTANKDVSFDAFQASTDNFVFQMFKCAAFQLYFVYRTLFPSLTITIDKSFRVGG